MLFLCAPLGRSDHAMVYLVPAYKQRLKTVKPVKRTVKQWTPESLQALQGCFDCTEWAVFKNSSQSLDEYTDVVTSYINFCEESIIPTKAVTIYGNSKPWYCKEVYEQCKRKNAAYKVDDVEFKRAKYAVDREVRKAKHRYREKIEDQFASGNGTNVWKGIQTITDYKQKSVSSNDDPTLPDQLNDFYARFDKQNTTSVSRDISPTALPPPFVVEESKVRKILSKQKPKKAAGPDGVSTAALRYCSEQLAPVLTDIFNRSLEQGKVPHCFKSAVIVPVPKKSKITGLNDYRPVALTSVVMKVFERLVLWFLRAATELQSDPMQFAYKANRSVDDAVSLTLHKILQHLETPKSYARILFLDFSSAFNTIVPQRLYDKLLNTFCVDQNMCNWVLDFLLNRSQVVRVGGLTSGKLVLNTGAPQGCVLSPLLFTLFTNDCRSSHDSVVLVKFSDDTTVSGLISKSDETAYRGEVEGMVSWCEENNLLLNVTKTKEIVVDFRTVKTPTTPLIINDQAVEQVDSFKFLGSTISSDLSWSCHTINTRKKAQQRMYFLRQLKKFGMDKSILVQFYRSIVESVLTFSFTTWYGSTTQEEKDGLQNVVKTASKIIGCDLPDLDTLYHQRVTRRAKAIVKDTSHPAHDLFQPLPSQRRYRCIRARTERFKRSFFPRAVKSL